jgi:hypothetical protein
MDLYQLKTFLSLSATLRKQLLIIVGAAAVCFAQGPSFRGVESVNTYRNAAYCPDTSIVANTVTCSTAVGFTGPLSGQAIDLLLANTITGAATIAINGFAAKAITYNGSTVMAAGIMVAGGTYRLQYDGTEYVLQGSASSGSSTGCTTAGAVWFTSSTPGVCAQDPTNFFWSLSSHWLGIGTNTPLWSIDVEGTNEYIANTSFGTGSNAAIIMRMARGTSGAPTATQAGDLVGILGWRGYGATGFTAVSRAEVAASAAENWTDTAQGMYLSFLTTASGALVRTEKMRVQGSGGVSIGSVSTDPGAGNVLAQGLGGSGTTCVQVGNTGILANAAGPCGVSPTTNQNIRTIGASFGSFQSGASALSAGATACVPVYYAGTIKAVHLIGNVSGSVTVDVQTVLHASWTGTASVSSITAADIPALSSAAAYTDTTLTGWTTTLAANTDVCFVMTSPTTIAGASITVEVAAN